MVNLVNELVFVELSCSLSDYGRILKQVAEVQVFELFGQRIRKVPAFYFAVRLRQCRPAGGC